jgi:hypothetical protein
MHIGIYDIVGSGQRAFINSFDVTAKKKKQLQIQGGTL